MPAIATAVESEPRVMAGRCPDAAGEPCDHRHDVHRLRARVHAEYSEMPGLRLTLRQAARLFGLPADVTESVLNDLHHAAVLIRSTDGAYALNR